jgi:hypothetical protein
MDEEFFFIPEWSKRSVMVYSSSKYQGLERLEVYFHASINLQSLVHRCKRKFILYNTTYIFILYPGIRRCCKFPVILFRDSWYEKTYFITCAEKMWAAILAYYRTSWWRGITVSHSGGPEFKSQPRDQLSWLKFFFRGFPHSVETNTGILPHIRPRSLPYTSISSYHLTL